MVQGTYKGHSENKNSSALFLFFNLSAKNFFNIKECVGWEKANGRFIVPTAQDEVKAAINVMGCSRNKTKLFRDANHCERSKGWKQKKHAISAANEGDCDLCRNYTRAGKGRCF